MEHGNKERETNLKRFIRNNKHTEERNKLSTEVSKTDKTVRQRSVWKPVTLLTRKLQYLIRHCFKCYAHLYFNGQSTLTILIESQHAISYFMAIVNFALSLTT